MPFCVCCIFLSSPWHTEQLPVFRFSTGGLGMGGFFSGAGCLEEERPAGCWAITFAGAIGAIPETCNTHLSTNQEGNLMGTIQ